MLGLSRRWRLVVAVIGLLKIASVFLVPVCCDFVNWVNLASVFFSRVSMGEMPSVASTGPYTSLGLFLTLFFAIWMSLPVPHPPLPTLIGKHFFLPSIEGYLLLFLMKLPILLFDFLAAVLVYLLAKRATGSASVGGKVFLLWYINPLNLYLMNSWENPGTFDIIPAAILLLAIFLCGSKRWLEAGICVAATTMLRLFPILLLPFFLIYSFRESRQASAKLSLGFIAPIAGALLSQIFFAGSFNEPIGSLSAILLLPIRNPWLLNYYGFPIGPYLTLMPFFILVQLYLVGRYWRKGKSLVTVVTVALFSVFATTYHQPYHFIWIMPILTVYCATHKNDLMLLIPLSISAFLYSEGYATSNSTLFLLQPLFVAIFYGVKAVYLIKINTEAVRLHLRQSVWGIVSANLLDQANDQFAGPLS